MPGTDLGTVYLLHFSEPYPAGKKPQHYIGWCGPGRNLDDRLEEHRSGQGARLLQVIKEKGITFELARTWPGSKDRERQLKRNGGRAGRARGCPLCGITPRNTQPGKQKN